MADYSEKGIRLLWPDALERARGLIQRVTVDAGPVAPFDILRVLYSVSGSPERAVYGWPTGMVDPVSGLQGFAANLPVPGPDKCLSWRPVLCRGGFEIDPLVDGLMGIIGDREEPTLSHACETQNTDSPDIPFQMDFIAHCIMPFKGDFHPLGETPDGVHMLFQIREGGRIDGPHLSGDILPVGGDWMHIRQDGIGEINAKTMIRTDNGALIMLTEYGLCDFGADGYSALTRGHLPKQAKVRVTPRYLTSAQEFKWLNRIQGFGIGDAHLEHVTLHYDVYDARSVGRADFHGG